MESIDIHMNWQVRYIHKLVLERLGRYRKHLEKVPNWLRGLSVIQIEAAYMLANALRDDMEQKTINNVVHIVTRLGLHPRPHKYNIKILIHMSRGNDLAFLWFLMETCYKTEYHGMSYNANEQIIMTCIYRLDVFPVMRELDRILPLPQDPNSEIEMLAKEVEKQRKHAMKTMLLERNKKIQKSQVNIKSKKPTKNDSDRKTLKLPYFEKLVMPKILDKRLTAEYPARPVSFRTPPMETTLFTRWFGDFSLQENNLVISSMLQKEIKSIVRSFQNAKVTENDLHSICEHHKRITEMEESLKDKLEAIKLMRFRDFADVTTRKQEKRRKRIVADLEEMSNKYLAQFHEMATKTRVLTIRKHLSLSSKSQDAPNKQDYAFMGHSISDIGKEEATEESTQYTSKHKNSGVFNLLAHGHERNNCSACSNNNKVKSEMEPSPDKFFLDHFLRTSVHDWDENEGQTNKSQQSNANYFEVSDMGGTPSCKFNYRELFGSDSDKWMDNEKQRLKEAFITAIDSDVAFLNAAMDGNGNSDSIDEAISRTVKKIFKDDLDIFTQEYQRLVNKKARKKNERLDFGQKKFDPDNKEQMREMLRIALNHVGKDKRFVLPTLPDVEYVPLLMEWICFRYGKKYSLKERQEIFKRGSMILQALMLMLKGNMVEPPRTKFPGARMVRFEDQKCLRRVAKRLHVRYKALFCQTIMEVSRIFYYVMRPHLSSYAYNTFYAYMPSHYFDTGFSCAKKASAVAHWIWKKNYITTKLYDT